MRDSAIFYRSFYEAIKELPPENQSEVYAAVFEYALNFKVVELSGISKTIFTLIKPQLQANNRKYKAGKLGGEYGKLGGRGKKRTSKETPNKPLQIIIETPNVNENVNNNENINTNEKENDNRNDNRGKELFPFINFWDIYNKKTEHSVCEAKWKELSNKDKQVIMERLPAYIEATPEVHFRKNPATYLAHRIWEDEHLPAVKPKEYKSAFERLIETGSYE